MVGNRIKVLLDTNILIDILCGYDRLSAPASAIIIQAIRDGRLEGVLTTQSIVDASYILSRMPDFSSGLFREKILHIMSFINVEALHCLDVRDAVLQPGRDFEDDVHYAHAMAEGLQELQRKQFNSALSWFDRAVGAAEDDASRDRYARYYKAFYLMNRGVLKAEMIDFIASLEGNVQTLSMDTDGTTRARVSDRVARSYDYSEAIADIKEALTILPDIPYLYFDLGNLECLSSRFVEALENYDMAIRLYPNMGDAYYNRGLVLIYLKDKEKGCIDLSRAGELGVADSYSVISKYCSEDELN